MSHDDKDSPLTTWLRRQGASALERDAADRIDQLERDLHKLEMEMPDYRECCALREKAERELAEVRADLKRERLGAFVDPQYSGHDVPTPAQRPSLGTPGGIPLDADFEHEAPDTPGTWQERCSVLYQVIGGMAAHFGIFETSDDVSAALDVAAGRGDVDKLLPWPKTALSHRATTDFDEWWAVWISSRQTPNKPSAKDAARAGWAARSAIGPTREELVEAAGDITKIKDGLTADRVGLHRLFDAMEEKLYAKSLEGRGGWNNDCTVEYLENLLRLHIDKPWTARNLVDIANFCMMLWNRHNPSAPADDTAKKG